MSEELRAEVARLTGEVARLGKAVDALIENELRKPEGQSPVRCGHRELPAIQAALEALLEIERARDDERRNAAKRVLVTINQQDCPVTPRVSVAGY